MSELGQRVTVAAVGIPIGVAIVYLGRWPVAAILAVVAMMGTRELYRFAEERGARPFSALGQAASSVLVLAAAGTSGLAEWSTAAMVILLVLTLGTLAAAVFVRGPSAEPMAAVAVTSLGAVYVGMTMSFGVHLRTLPMVGDGGPGWTGALVLIFPLTITWVGDAAAYFGGHRWGHRKLIPSVSPGKTVEGGIWGLIGTVVAGMVFAALLLNLSDASRLTMLQAAAIGLSVGAISQIGDLGESLLKREAGVKDSGTLFPGHGGILDRFDSVFFTLPLTYILMCLFLR